MANCQISWVLIVAEELYGDFEDLETGVVHKGKPAAEGDEVWPVFVCSLAIYMSF